MRLHTGDDADRAARRNGAHAVTIGEDIFIREGRFDPSTPRGLALLSHEIVHVAQQRCPVDGVLAAAGGDREGHEREALAVEHQVLELLRPARAHAAPAVEARVRAGHDRPGTAPAARGAPFRAAEDRPLEAAGSAPQGPGADPADLAEDVYHLLERRMRIERERLRLGRA